jgi:hypothetical protein
MTEVFPSHGATVATGRTAPGHTDDDGDAPDWDRQSPLQLSTGRIASIVVALAWAVICALMLARPIFISHDSLSNNVHVWFIAEELWGGNGIPMHVPNLANGEALTFPYGSIPWTTAAILWPLLEDRAVTLWLVVGFALTVVATFWTFPTLRRGWWAAATMTNPSLVISPVLGQLPFLWGIAAFTFAVGLWRRGRVLTAVLLTAAASIIHPAVVMPIIALTVVLWLPFEAKERRRSLVGWWLLTVVVSLPAVWAVFQSPVVAQTSTATQIGALLQTVGMRLLVLLVPIVLVLMQHVLRPPGWTPIALTVVFVVLQWPMYTPFGMDFAWGSLTREPDAQVDAFVATDGVTPGDTYRVLTGLDGKYGLYAVARAGGVLDAEFFPEGLHRGPFSSEESYARFLRERQVDTVVSFPSYTQRYTRSNEPDLLEAMSTEGCVEGVEITRRPGDHPWSVYDVDRSC